MANWPPMPINVSALTADTGHMNDTEIGCNFLLMMSVWRSPECRVRDNVEHLVRVCRTTPKRWRQVRPILMDLWDSDGKYLTPGEIGRRHVNWGAHPSRWLRAEWREIRELVLGDSPVCTYCNTDKGPFEVDHVIPRSRGGTNDIANLAVACIRCNRSKGAKMVNDWLAATY